MPPRAINSGCHPWYFSIRTVWITSNYRLSGSQRAILLSTVWCRRREQRNCDCCAVWRYQGVRGEAIGEHQGGHTVLPHQLFHIATYRGNHGRGGQPVPSDALKGEGVIGIPEDGDLVPNRSTP